MVGWGVVMGRGRSAGVRSSVVMVRMSVVVRRSAVMGISGVSLGM